MLVIQATYTGQASLGFVTGMVYTLEVYPEGSSPAFVAMPQALIIRSTQAPHQSCPYGSWARFLDFWSNVTKLNPQP